jgi:hypothetical protein
VNDPLGGSGSRHDTAGRKPGRVVLVVLFEVAWLLLVLHVGASAAGVGVSPVAGAIALGVGAVVIAIAIGSRAAGRFGMVAARSVAVALIVSGIASLASSMPHVVPDTGAIALGVVLLLIHR